MGILRKIYTRTTLLEGTVHLVRGSWKMFRVKLISWYWRYNFARCGKRLVVFPKVRIEFPKNISAGDDVSVNVSSYLKSENPTARLIIHDGVAIGGNVEIDWSGGLVIGTRTVITTGASVHTHVHGADGLDPWAKAQFKPLRIGRNVWIAAEAMILPQVSKIGDGAVVAARAVVTKDVPPRVVVAGNPARVIKKLPKKR